MNTRSPIAFKDGRRIHSGPVGGDPTVSGDTPAPTMAATPGGGFIYTFTRADRARGSTTVVAKLSDDLATWPPARDILVGNSSTSDVTVTDEVDHESISIQIPGEPLRTFLRLEVSVPAAPSHLIRNSAPWNRHVERVRSNSYGYWDNLEASGTGPIHSRNLLILKTAHV